jgi:hypothetical protein
MVTSCVRGLNSCLGRTWEPLIHSEGKEMVPPKLQSFIRALETWLFSIFHFSSVAALKRASIPDSYVHISLTCEKHMGARKAPCLYPIYSQFHISSWKPYCVSLFQFLAADKTECHLKGIFSYIFPIDPDRA